MSTGSVGCAGPAPLRLTRRGRLLLLWLIVLPMAALLVLRGGELAGAASSSVPPARTVVVQAGDTLWAIAREAAPDADPREVVDSLQRINGLRGSIVVPGQEIRLPDLAG